MMEESLKSSLPFRGSGGQERRGSLRKELVTDASACVAVDLEDAHATHGHGFFRVEREALGIDNESAYRKDHRHVQTRAPVAFPALSNRDRRGILNISATGGRNHAEQESGQSDAGVRAGRP